MIIYLQRKAFEGVRKVLRSGGFFILSYPDKELAEILRPNLLGVEVNQTRFKLTNGKIYVVPSIVYYPGELQYLLESVGFVDIEIKQVRVRDSRYVQPTKYIRDVARIMDKDVHDIPVVMVAKAVKT